MSHCDFMLYAGSILIFSTFFAIAFEVIRDIRKGKDKK